jgi:hypothetical protein
MVQLELELEPPRKLCPTLIRISRIDHEVYMDVTNDMRPGGYLEHGASCPVPSSHVPANVVAGTVHGNYPFATQ